MNVKARLLVDVPGGGLTTPMWGIAAAIRWGFPAMKIMRALLEESTARMPAVADCSPRATFPYDPVPYHATCTYQSQTGPVPGWMRSEGGWMIGAAYFATGLPGLVRHSTCFNVDLYCALLRARVMGWDTALNNVPAGDGGASYQETCATLFDEALEWGQILHFTGPSQWRPVTGGGALYRQRLAEEEAWQRWRNDTLAPPAAAGFVMTAMRREERPALSYEAIAHYAAA